MRSCAGGRLGWVQGLVAAFMGAGQGLPARRWLGPNARAKRHAQVAGYILSRADLAIAFFLLLVVLRSTMQQSQVG